MTGGTQKTKSRLIRCKKNKKKAPKSAKICHPLHTSQRCVNQFATYINVDKISCVTNHCPMSPMRFIPPHPTARTKNISIVFRRLTTYPCVPITSAGTIKLFSAILLHHRYGAYLVRHDYHFFFNSSNEGSIFSIVTKQEARDIMMPARQGSQVLGNFTPDPGVRV